MRTLKFVLSSLLCIISTSSAIAVGIPSRSIEFQGTFGDVPAVIDHQSPANFERVLFPPTLSESVVQELSTLNSGREDFSFIRGEAKTFQTLELQYTNPLYLQFGNTQISDPPQKGIYIYNGGTNLVGYYLLNNLHLDDDYKTDQNYKKIRQLPSRLLQTIPGTLTPIPSRLKLVEYSKINGDYVEKFVFIENKFHSVLTLTAFYPKEIEEELAAKVKQTFIEQINSYNIWLPDEKGE